MSPKFPLYANPPLSLLSLCSCVSTQASLRHKILPKSTCTIYRFSSLAGRLRAPASSSSCRKNRQCRVDLPSCGATTNSLRGRFTVPGRIGARILWWRYVVVWSERTFMVSFVVVVIGVVCARIGLMLAFGRLGFMPLWLVNQFTVYYSMNISPAECC